MSEIKKIAILTGGGDCPGLNAVIRAVVKTAIENYGLEVVGIKKGYYGLYHKYFTPLTLDMIDEILVEGGTILQSSNKDNLFIYPKRGEDGEILRDENGKIVYHDVSDVAVKNLEEAGIDALFILGGDGTLTSGRDFARKGVKVVAIPKTIDNDLAFTDYTFGFDTAVSTVSESIDKLRTTTRSHDRISVVEIMGRGAGWLTLHGGIAGGADVILLPEIPFDIEKVAEKIRRDRAHGKNYTIIACAEGAKEKDGEAVVMKVREDSPDPIRLGGIAKVVADKLEEMTGYEARATVLGHVQRGGSPSAHDRVLSTVYGNAAVRLAMEEGIFGHMVIKNGTDVSHVSLEDVIGKKTKNVEPDDRYVRVAREIGICLGD